MEHLDNKTIDACAKEVDAVMKKHMANGNKVTLQPHDQASIIVSLVEVINYDLQNHLQALKQKEPADETTNL